MPEALTLNRGSPCPPRRVAQGSELWGLVTPSEELKRAKEAGALPLGWRSAGAAEEDVDKHPTAEFRQLRDNAQVSQRPCCRAAVVTKPVMNTEGWLVRNLSLKARLGQFYQVLFSSF